MLTQRGIDRPDLTDHDKEENDHDQKKDPIDRTDRHPWNQLDDSFAS